MQRTFKLVLACLLLLALSIPITLTFNPVATATEPAKTPEIIKLKDPVKRGIRGPHTIPDLSGEFEQTIIARITMLDVSNLPDREGLTGALTYEMLPEGFEIYPHKFAIDAQENIYIPDIITNTIIMYSPKGTYVKAIPIPRGRGETEITGIDEIVVDKNGIYISNTRIVKKYDFSGRYLFTIRPQGMESETDVDIQISQLRILPSGKFIFNVQKNWEPISTQIYDEQGRFVQTDIAYYFELTRDRVLKVLNAALDVDQFQIFEATGRDLQSAFNLTFPPNTTRCYVEIKGDLLYFYELNEAEFLHVYAINVIKEAKSLYLKIDKTDYADDDRMMTDFKMAANTDRFFFMQRVGEQLLILRYNRK